MSTVVSRSLEARKIPLDQGLGSELAALEDKASEPFAHALEETRPVRATGWLPWLRTRKAEALTPAAQPSEDNGDPRPEVQDSRLRAWIEGALRQLDTNSETRIVRMDDGQSELSERISIEQPLVDGPATLLIEDVQVISNDPETVGLLDLGGLARSELKVRIENCAVDRVSIAGSRLRDVLIQDLSCIRNPGIIFYANDATVARQVRVVGSDLPPLFSEFQSVTTRYPRKLENCFVRIEATNLTCDELTVWNIALNGPHYLQWLQKTNPTAFGRRYRVYAKGLVLHGAKLNRLLAYQCHFHGPVTIRFATIESQTKFEACHFQGYELPLKYFANRDVRDEFDSDDFRPLNGMVLDASRARLGRELVFRQIDPHLREEPKRSEPRSSGWMNWSHSSTETLNDDTTLWGNVDGKRWSRGGAPQMRFRLNGFAYDSLTVGHLLPAPRESASLVQAGPAGEGDQDATPSPELPQKKTPTSRKEERAAERISWLYCQLTADLCEEFMAQPWTQCGRAFLTAGNRSQANRLFQERERLWHRSLLYRRSDLVSERVRALALYMWHFLVSALPGYGYRMWAPFAVGIGVWLVGWVVFTSAFSDGFMMQNPDATNEMLARTPARSWDHQQNPQSGAGGTPTKITTGADQVLPLTATVDSASAEGTSAGARSATEPDSRDRYASPYPLMYSLDLLVPVIEFGQSNYWIPGENPERQATSGALAWTPEERQSYLDWVWFWYWVQIGMGWYLSTVIVTSLAGLFEREH